MSAAVVRGEWIASPDQAWQLGPGRPIVPASLCSVPFRYIPCYLLSSRQSTAGG